MVREYKRYDEYKDSGIEWLGEIPKTWILSKVKYEYNFFTGFTPSSGDDSYYDIDGYNWLNISDIKNKYVYKANSKISHKAIRDYRPRISKKNSLVFSFKLSIGKTAILKNNIYTNEALATFEKNKKNNIRYLYYIAPIFIPKNAKENIYGAKILNQRLINDALLLKPPKQEQQKIATFLGYKTAEIDEIINKKESLIDSLEKYKKSVITEAVTNGKLGDKYLNEDGELVDEIEMKDSGIEWIGEIPKRWDKIKFKYLFSYQKGNSPNEYLDKVNGVPYLSMDYLRGNNDEITYVRNDPNMIKVENNQILLLWDGSNSGEFIKSKKGLLSSTMSVITDIKIDKDFSFYYFKASEKYLKDQTIGMGIPHVDSKILKNIYFTVPNKNLQQKIASFLDQKTSEIDFLIEKTKKSTEKYKEYKKSLIFEAVTGKIDLRDYELEGGEEIVEHNNSRETKREEFSEVN